MPDWLTHVLFAWALWNIISIKFNILYRGVFLTGSIVPDIKIVYLLFPKIESYLSVFHTPIGIIIISGILARLAFKDNVKKAYIFLVIGISSLFHLFLDLLVNSMEGRVMLFFPFSFNYYSLNIFMQEDFTFLYFAFLALFTSLVFRRLRGKNNTNKTL